MKKLLTVIMITAMLLFATNVMADPPLKGLEINGGATVGAQLFDGYSNTDSYTNGCFSNSSTYTHQNFEGVGISSSANGAICVTKTNCGNCSYTSGSGDFRAGMSGNVDLMDMYNYMPFGFGVSFYTHSHVDVSGSSGHNH
ncbi:MAG: hypothetical protein KAW47_10790 [Thermoplasmatales archaeon]|nr:hypothetical protein [Thermoplasmatales archaeon]